jgi:hypothetical protein
VNPHNSLTERLVFWVGWYDARDGVPDRAELVYDKGKPHEYEKWRKIYREGYQARKESK